jgi:hypothetical protein
MNMADPSPELLAQVRGLRATASSLLANGDYRQALDYAWRAFESSDEALKPLYDREAPERLPWQVEQIAALSDIVVAQLSLGNLGDVAERVRQLQGMLADIDLEFVGFGTGTGEHSNYSPTGACLARPPCPPAS